MRTIQLNFTVFGFLHSENILALQKTVIGNVSAACINQLLPVLNMVVNYGVQGINIDANSPSSLTVSNEKNLFFTSIGYLAMEKTIDISNQMNVKLFPGLCNQVVYFPQ
jgi:hypothetical protein